MKQLLLTLCLLMFCSVSFVNAQSRVKERDLKGVWKMEIPIDEAEGDSPAERILLNVVEGFIDEMNIYFEFKKNNELKVTVKMWGETEVEYSEWYINEDGSLSIGESDHLDTEDSVWMFKGRRLASYDYNKRGKLVRDSDVYLRRVKR